MTTLTVPVLIVAIFGIATRHGYGRAVALGGSTAAGAAAYAGGLAVPTFYAIALGAIAVLMRQGCARTGLGRAVDSSGPTVPLLLLVLVWGVLVTFLAPLLFPGLHTVTVAGNELQAGVLTSSNVAQTMYFLLGIAVVAALAHDEKTSVGLVGLSIGVGIVLSLWRYTGVTLGLPYPDGFFDNSPTLDYIETAPKDVSRFRGIYSEPSSLAVACLTMITYGLARLRQVHAWRRWALVLLIASATFLGVISTSTTFVVAGSLIAAVAMVTALTGFLTGRTRVARRVAVGVCAGALTSVWVLPLVVAFARSSVEAKVGTSSYEQRSGVDASSYDVFFRTWGLGVGFGSGRASSLVPTLLSTLGVVGTLLIVLALGAAIVGASRSDEARPAVWTLVALLCAKVVSGPDLADPSGLLWITLGILLASARRSQKEMQQRAQRPHQASIAIEST